MKPCFEAGLYGYLAGIGVVFTLAIGADGQLPSTAEFDDVSATPAGEALGITDTNVDRCWHNVFKQSLQIFSRFLRKQTNQRIRVSMEKLR